MNTYDPETGRWTTDADRYEAIRQGKPEYRALDDAVWDDPERAWPILLDLISELPEDLVGLAGAGPLEEFVVHHAAAFVDRIEARARAREDHRFRECLSCIWLSGGALPRAIQQRLLDAAGGRILLLQREE
jgi:hypothetical protein